MLLSYNEAIEEYENAYKLAKAVSDGSIYKIEDGIYSTQKHISELEIILKKYPKSVLTGEYAFYVNVLTNLIP